MMENVSHNTSYSAEVENFSPNVHNEDEEFQDDQMAGTSDFLHQQPDFNPYEGVEAVEGGDYEDSDAGEVQFSMHQSQMIINQARTDY